LQGEEIFLIVSLVLQVEVVFSPLISFDLARPSLDHPALLPLPFSLKIRNLFPLSLPLSNLYLLSTM